MVTAVPDVTVDTVATVASVVVADDEGSQQSVPIQAPPVGHKPPIHAERFSYTI